MMMDEIVKAVADRTGLSMEQSKMAVQAAMDFMMSKMPEGMGTQLQAMMTGSDMSGAMGDMNKMMGDTGDMGKMIGDMGKLLGGMGGSNPGS